MTHSLYLTWHFHKEGKRINLAKEVDLNWYQKIHFHAMFSQTLLGRHFWREMTNQGEKLPMKGAGSLSMSLMLGGRRRPPDCRGSPPTPPHPNPPYLNTYVWIPGSLGDTPGQHFTRLRYYCIVAKMTSGLAVNLGYCAVPLLIFRLDLLQVCIFFFLLPPCCLFGLHSSFPSSFPMADTYAQDNKPIHPLCAPQTPSPNMFLPAAVTNMSSNGRRVSSCSCCCCWGFGNKLFEPVKGGGGGPTPFRNLGGRWTTLHFFHPVGGGHTRWTTLCL